MKLWQKDGVVDNEGEGCFSFKIKTNKTNNQLKRRKMTSPSILVSEKSNSPSSAAASAASAASVDPRFKSDNSENSSRVCYSRSYNHHHHNNNNLHNNNNNNNNSSNATNTRIDDPDSKATAGQKIVRTAESSVIMCGQRNIDLLRRRRSDIGKDEEEEERLIVVNENKVYDLTDFARFHPGGSEILHEYRGQDITNVMKSDQFHKHSRTAYTILDKYYVGDYHGTGPGDDCKKSGDQGITEKEEENKNEFQFNWNKPILGQLDQLGDKYFDWVHEPEEHHIRLFRSDFCEYFSKSPWWLVPLIWLPITCLALYYSYQNIWTQTEMLHLPFAKNGFEVKANHLPVIYVAGILQWTLLEYVIHRWIFHLKPIHSSPMFIRFHFLLHGQHHKAPMDKRRLVFPPVPAFMFAVSIYKLLRLAFPVAVTQSLFAGTVLGYLTYDLIHYYLHHGTPAVHYFRELKHYHMLHHYVHQHSGFGISSKLWDYPFGTLISTHPHN